MSETRKTDEEIRERLAKWEAELARECMEPRPDREIKNLCYARIEELTWVWGSRGMYYLHRLTSLHDWQVCQTHWKTLDRPEDGEIIELPDCHWFSQAKAEADRLNGKQDEGQGSLLIQ